ncbi:MAG: conjugative transposon protein TraN [Dyadobacter sp. 50-39]|uniref:conjugative transposon protein TraN n=1 Tax=Dyadobacter sp. 50-39 TaxID=1895756 RepID=UPI00095E3D45|nr:conjugative transposon protein TraN [Dyadobacter sp. 50-39]OJV13227.1 MAG: conjugative transposon protein TraN [Dyadobacter sp. 50-39]
MYHPLKWIFQLILLLETAAVFSQDHSMQMFVSQPFPLELTTAKTTHLVFPYDIVSVDKGSGDILAQKAKGVSNILRVKAAVADFHSTSLTVITSDGKLYSFTVDYAAEPLQLTIEFAGSSLGPNASLDQFQPNQAELNRLAGRVMTQPKHLRSIKDKNSGSSLALHGIYTSQDVIFCQLEMTNNSQISYDIGSLRFFIRDKKRAKRTAVQQLEIRPVYVKGDTAVIGGKSAHSFVYALPKFTIPDKKYLAIELMEKNGGRHLELEISGKALLKASAVAE